MALSARKMMLCLPAAARRPMTVLPSLQKDPSHTSHPAGHRWVASLQKILGTLNSSGRKTVLRRHSLICPRLSQQLQSSSLAGSEIAPLQHIPIHQETPKSKIQNGRRCNAQAASARLIRKNLHVPAACLPEGGPDNAAHRLHPWRMGLSSEKKRRARPGRCWSCPLTGRTGSRGAPGTRARCLRPPHPCQGA